MAMVFPLLPFSQMFGEVVVPVGAVFQAADKFLGADLVLCLEGPVEVGVVTEAAALIHFRRRFSSAEHLLGHNQPLLDDVTVD